MRRELLTFAVDPPVGAVQADPDVARLVTLSVRAGGTVNGVFVDDGGTELAVVVELDDDEPSPGPEALPPRLRLLSCRVQEHAPRSTPVVPRLVEPDPTLVDARPVPWRSVEVEPDGTAVVTFMRGILERLHSVEVTASPGGTVHIAVLLGRPPGPPPTGPVPAVGIVERTRVRLPVRFAGGE